MILVIAVFIAVAFSSCMKAYEQYTCADDAGLLLCLRAQDRVNWLIEEKNDTMQPLFLNCSQYIIANGIEWQSNLGVSVYFSTYLNAACYRAMKVFDSLLKKYQLNNTLPIECETIQGSKDYSTASTLFFNLLTIFFAVIIYGI